MRNILKYPPLEWRKQRQYCVPSGPNFAWAPTVKLSVGGSRLCFRAPRHAPRRRGVAQTRHPSGLDVLQDPYNHGMPAHSPGLMANDHWGSRSGISRRWAFWGPWMTGGKAELAFSVSVMGRTPGHEFSELSLFHPKAFGTVLAQYLDDRYGHENQEMGGGSRQTAYWHGPVNWKQREHLPVFSASFNIFRRESDMPGKTEAERLRLGHTPRHLFVFPITDQHFAHVVFEHHWYSTDDDGAPLFDPSPVQALQEAIIDSFTLELSSEAQASYDKVKSQHRDMQLSKDFAPLKWPTQTRGADSEFGDDEPYEASLALRGGL